jgi:hypothetical protein
MKTKIFILAALACIAVSFAATEGCVNKSNAPNANATGNMLVLNLYDGPTNWMDQCSSGSTGGYWNQTYTDTINTIRFGEFIFSHLPAGAGAAFGGNGCSGMYWDGFTTGSNGDPTNYGQYADSTGSIGWINHQWGVMAGGGLDTIPPSYQTVKGMPYLIAYWGYYMEPEYYYTLHNPGTPPDAPMHCLTVALADSSLFTPQGVYICNHPWPYWGVRKGDGFAHPFKELGEDAHFDLIIHAVGLNETTEYVHTLATYDSSQPDSVRVSSDWEYISLEDMGNDIRYLYFTMYSTDELVIGDKNYGPNTAVYFNLDKLAVIKQDGTAGTAFARKAEAPAPAKSAKSIEVTDVFPVPSYTGGDVTVLDKQGNVALQTTVTAGEKINLSKLPKGEYRLRHGHKHIPITKK